MLILGEKVYKKVFYYFNSVGEEKQYEIMEDAKKALKATLRKTLLKLNSYFEDNKIYLKSLPF